MQFFTIAALFAATAIASPAHGPSSLCGNGLYSNPLCCNTDVLGVASLDCHVPNRVPGNFETFSSVCNGKGKAPKCCVLPVAGQGVLCKDPIGA